MAAADRVVIPCQLEARAADGLVERREVLVLLKGEAGASWRILLTQVDRRKTTTYQAVLAALAPWQPHLCTTTILHSEPLNQAHIARTDLCRTTHTMHGRKNICPKGQGPFLLLASRGGRAAGRRFIEAVKIHLHLANVGDAKSLVIHPDSTTHQQLTDAEQVAAGISPDMIRISVVRLSPLGV